MRSSCASRRRSNRGPPEWAPEAERSPAPRGARLHPFPLWEAASSPPPRSSSRGTPESRLQTGCKEWHARKAPGRREGGAHAGAQSPCPHRAAGSAARHTPPKTPWPGPFGARAPHPAKPLTRGAATAAAGGEQEGAEESGRPHASRPEGERLVSEPPAAGG